MSFEDKSLECHDCNTTFTFSVGEQEQFASLGFTNDPKRCPACRQARKARHEANNGNSYHNDNSGYRPVRQMFTVKCSECGNDAQVPFEPRTGKPVYCGDCYRKISITR